MTCPDLDILLEESSDPGYRDFNARLIPYNGKMYGVRLPVLRKIAKTIMKGDWHSFMEEPSGSFEQSMIRALIIGSAKMGSDERLDRLLEFIPEVDNWAVCDTLCGGFIVDSEESAVKLWHICIELLGTGKEFPMRVGAVMMLSHFIDDHHIEDVLNAICRTASSGYYYDMGAAWALSYCYISYPEITEKILFSGCASMELMGLTVKKVRESRRVDAEDKERLKGRLAELRAIS